MRATCLAALLVLTACAPKPVDPEVLKTADRQFAKDVATGGGKAWASWFAEDGRQVQPGVYVTSRADVEKLMTPAFDDKDFKLDWDPDFADVSGDLGWTTGRWQAYQAGAKVREGRYVTIWKRQSDGSWKVAMDLGNPDPKP